MGSIEHVLGSRIKKLRIDKNLTQLELSKILNISNTTLSQYESGKRIPNDYIKLKIADYFDISLDYLLGRSSKDFIKISHIKNVTLSSYEIKLINTIRNFDSKYIDEVNQYIEFLKLKNNRKKKHR